MTKHEIKLRVLANPDTLGGWLLASCTCGTWRTSQVFTSRATLPDAVNTAKTLAQRHHLIADHTITITNDPHPVQGGNVWGSCSCLGWGTVQGYVRNLGQGVAERLVRHHADEHLKEIANR
ncbi:hypothetical protein AB0K18_43030 [Nonomuraea sp. NPDC049421]|uniref:hypothetical protein n=1 Tax=Nonomuraea sp. NPDC049421 TaxID=3155275 RepID=UPI00341C580E